MLVIAGAWDGGRGLVHLKAVEGVLTIISLTPFKSHFSPRLHFQIAVFKTDVLNCNMSFYYIDLHLHE